MSNKPRVIDDDHPPKKPPYVQMEFESILNELFNHYPQYTEEEKREYRKAKRRMLYEEQMKKIHRPKENYTHEKKSDRPKLKYLHVARLFRSKRAYFIDGCYHRRKTYGLGILTEDNDYYYSEITIKHSHLVHGHLGLIKRALTIPFLFTENTRVTVSSEIIDYNDPVLNFMKIVGNVVGFSVRRSGLDNMVKQATDFFNLVPYKKFSSHIRNRAIKKMFEQKRFVFITDPEWEDKLELAQSYSRKSQIECAIGMIYIYIKDYVHESAQRTEEKHAKGLPVRKYVSREEKERMAMEKKMMDKKWMEEVKKYGSPPEYYVDDKHLGRIKLINVLWWVEKDENAV